MRIPIFTFWIAIILTNVECSVDTHDSRASLNASSEGLLEFCESPSFSKSDFIQLWKRFYQQNGHLANWTDIKNELLVNVIALNAPEKFRALVESVTTEHPSALVYDPTSVLYQLLSDQHVSDENKSKMVRMCLELGAIPILASKDGNTAAEILIRQNKASVLSALLDEPSPINYAVLEEMEEKDIGTYRGVEIYRTRLIREANKQKHKDMKAALESAHYYDFVDKYLTTEMTILCFLIVVIMLIQFLYQLRIKRIPVNSKLIIPRNVSDRNIWLPALQYGIATITSSIPTSNLFECIGLGIASFGGIVWSEVYTGRRDIAVVLGAVVVGQSLWTLIGYYLYAPTNATEDSDKFEEEIDITSHLHRVMFYPKVRDVSLALTNTAIYLLACSVSFVVLFNALDPINRMYTYSRHLSISDTYGIERSFTRAMALIWDMIIFAVLSIRVFRFVDTVNVYLNLNRRSGDQKRLPA